MAADLPPEILAEILSRLPVKSLFRFRSTSKSLKSLIDSQKFINLHLKNSVNFNLILRHNYTNLYQLPFPNLTTPIPLNHPFTRRNSKNIVLLGSCNGLLAISNSEFVFSNPKEITFWNPTIRKYRIIRYLHNPIADCSQSDNTNCCAFCVHGFGFDPLSGDYKLLRISWVVHRQHSALDNSHLTLFSSKTNSWKILPDMPYVMYYTLTMGVFVENSLHWIMTRKLDGLQPCLIVAFNLTLEIFNEVPLPDELGEEVNGKKFEIRVAVLGGCLCMIVHYETNKVDVWVMNEYGSRDSWCKLFTLVKSFLDLPLKSLRPLGYSSDRSKVLLEIDCKKLFWYDLKSEQIGYVERISNFDEAMICVGSLVPPPLPCL